MKSREISPSGMILVLLQWGSRPYIHCRSALLDCKSLLAFGCFDNQRPLLGSLPSDLCLRQSLV